MTDQHEMWNAKHAAAEHEVYGFDPRSLATVIEPYLRPSSKILELGCGVGSDAHYFANQGHLVTATDFSETVINIDNERWRADQVSFEVVDLTKQLPYSDGSFDVCYANLSLHYFDDETTRTIFTDIRRVLSKGGLLAFSCKSTKDPKYGEGKQIGPDIFERNGHIRHFFSEEYCKYLLKDAFKIKLLGTDAHAYIGEESAFINCIAQKIPDN